MEGDGPRVELGIHCFGFGVSVLFNTVIFTFGWTFPLWRPLPGRKQLFGWPRANAALGNLTHNIRSCLGGPVLGAQDRGEKAFLFQGYSVSHDRSSLADALYIQEARDTVLALGLNE